MRELIIAENEAGQRFDKFLKKYLKDAPGSFIYKMLRKKNIVLNGKRASGSEILRGGDRAKLFLSEETLAKFGGSKEMGSGHSEDAEFFRKRLLYEDRDIILWNKPAGVLSQPADGEGKSAAEYLLQYLIASGQLDGEALRAFRPSPANRLDRNTSGILLCGKTLKGLQFLSGELGGHGITKQYLALADGKVLRPYRGDAWCIKDAKRNRVTLSDKKTEGAYRIATAFIPEAVNERASLVVAQLLTGRTHQIRAHLAYLGHPVLGDPKYGNREANRELAAGCGTSRQMLHAFMLGFPNDLTGDFAHLSGKEFVAPAPSDFRRAAAYLGLDDGIAKAEEQCSGRDFLQQQGHDSP